MNPFYLNSISYTIGWFWCLYFGIHGETLIAMAGALGLIALQLISLKKLSLLNYTEDFILALFSIPLGIALEKVLMTTGLIVYKNSSASWPPLWIIALYPLFALILNHSLSFIKKSATAAILIGFIAAPLSYLAGVKMGGAFFPHSLFITWIGIGIIWAAFLHLLSSLAKAIDQAASSTLDIDPKKPMKLLFDGDCPLCEREITFLKKRALPSTVAFIDISSPDFSSKENQGIDYITAMSEMHAIDPQGKLLVGIDAFSSLYARCRLPILATLLHLPFIRWLLTPLYQLFAKNRLRITGRCPLPPKK
jgi:predicted DCC family thiol-disulfide oxidoreductase YuxK